MANSNRTFNNRTRRSIYSLAIVLVCSMFITAIFFRTDLSVDAQVVSPTIPYTDRDLEGRYRISPEYDDAWITDESMLRVIETTCGLSIILHRTSTRNSSRTGYWYDVIVKVYQGHGLAEIQSNLRPRFQIFNFSMGRFAKRGSRAWNDPLVQEFLENMELKYYENYDCTNVFFVGTQYSIIGGEETYDKEFLGSIINSTGLTRTQSGNLDNYVLASSFPNFWIFHVNNTFYAQSEIKSVSSSWRNIQTDTEFENYWNALLYGSNSLYDLNLEGVSGETLYNARSVNLAGIHDVGQNIYLYPVTISIVDDLDPPFERTDFVLDTWNRTRFGDNINWCPANYGRQWYNYETTNDGTGGSNTNAQKYWIFCHPENEFFVPDDRSEGNPIVIFTELVAFSGNLRIIVENDSDVNLVELEDDNYGLALATLMITGNDDDNPCDQTGSVKFWENDSPSWFHVFDNDVFSYAISKPGTVSWAKYDGSDASGAAYRVFSRGTRRSFGDTTNHDWYLCLNALAQSDQTDYRRHLSNTDRISIAPSSTARNPGQRFSSIASAYQLRDSEFGLVSPNEDLTSAEKLTECPANFYSDLTSDAGFWSSIGRLFVDPIGQAMNAASSAVQAMSCILVNLFIPTDSDIQSVVRASAECDAAIQERYGEIIEDLDDRYGENYAEWFAEGGPACKAKDLFGVGFSAITEASSGQWPRCRQIFIDASEVLESDIILEEDIFDSNDDGIISAQEKQSLETLNNSFAVDFCNETDGSESIMKQAATILNPIVSSALALIGLLIFPRLIYYALTLRREGPRGEL